MSIIGGERVKSTWVTRHLPRDLPVTWEPPSDAIAGDLLLCEVVRTGLHGRVETASGSRRKLYAGDRIVCALANRYATSLLEAVARTDRDHADMVAASGLCGTVVTHTSKASNPTRLHLLGRAYVGSDPLNLRALPRPVPGPPGPEPRWIIVVGSAMDSGKTTACASVIRGLVDAGHMVAAAKLTGTASGRDFGAFRDAGADPVVDFLDAGRASTAGCTREELSSTADYLFARVREASVDWGVIEIADGLLQRETRMLLELVRSAAPNADIVVTTRESLSAVAAVELLNSFALRTVALSGLFTNSPLAREEAEASSNVSAVRTSELGPWFAQRATQLAAESAAEPVTVNPVDRMGAARS
jgi:molybdopterin-guanine dinucleotide biosynthesis protein